MEVVASPRPLRAFLTGLAALALPRVACVAPDAVQQALLSDDQCVAGDMACVFSALQRRGTVLAATSGSADSEPVAAVQKAADEAVSSVALDTTSGRRRRRHGGQDNDLTYSTEKRLLHEVAKEQEKVKKLGATFAALEETLNATHTLISTDPPVLLQKADDLHHPHHTKGAPPREKKVQGTLNELQKVLDVYWHRLSEDGRLIEWMKNKISHPDKVGDFDRRPATKKGGSDDEDEDDEEDDDDDDDDIALAQASDQDGDGKPKRRHGTNPVETHMKKQLKEITQEIKDIGGQIPKLQTKGEAVRKMYERKKEGIASKKSA